MFTIGTDRRARKHARELVQATRKLLRMNRDLLDARRSQELSTSCAQLEAAVAARAIGPIKSATEALEKQIDRSFPRPKHAGLSENVEVLLVAVIVAMAVRTFFLQPFKIPTGSMQPTLYGVFPAIDRPPIPYTSDPPSLLFRLAGLAFEGKIYERRGYRARGDHIFVDRFSYHFRKPKRGEVVVFDTSNIPELPEALRGRFYIKRLIGLPGDVVQIQPPHVLINGRLLDERPAFRRIYGQTNDYSGYVLPDINNFYGTPPAYLNTAKPRYTVPDQHFFVLGDNSHSSLDGRFWGSFPKRDLVGRAVLVYWPFTKRFGPVD